MASVTVDYILNVKGNASRAVEDLRSKVSGLGEAFAESARQAQRSPLISSFETLSSVLTQFGGTTSQVGILASSLARPIATLAGAVGGTTLAVGAAAASFALLSAGLLKGISTARNWTTSMIDVGTGLVSQREITRDQIQNLEQLSVSASRLETELAKLKVSVADDMAPSFTRMNEALTGTVRLMRELRDGSESVLGVLAGIIAIADKNPGNAIKAIVDSLIVGGRGGVEYDANYGPQLPTNYDEKQLERLRGMGAGPEYDPIAVGNLRRQQAEEQRRLAEENAEDQKRLADELQAAYEEKQQAIAQTLQKISETETKLMLQDWSQAARIAKDAANAAKEAAQKQKEIMSFSGGLGGTLQNTGNPVMQAIATVLNPVRLVADGFGMLVNEVFSLDDLLGSALDNALRVFGELPEEVFNIFGLLLPRFIRAMPEIVSQFIYLAPAIVWELVRASPIILGAMIEAILQLPAEFVRQFKEAFNLDNMLNAFKGVFGKNGTVATSARSLIDLKGEDKSIFGVKIPSFDTGGMVAQTGLVYAHKGERVLNRQETRNYNGGSVGAINVYSTADARAIAEELRNKLGPYGLNLSLAPRV